MTDEPTAAHDEFVELLPDYAVGAVDAATLRRVEDHLAGCASCRQELDDLLDLLGRLTVVAPPRPQVRAALLTSVGAEAAPPDAATPPPPDTPRISPIPPIGERIPAPADPIPPAMPAAPAPAPTADARLPTRLWDRVPVRLALAAVLVAALLSLAAWNVVLQGRLDDEDTIAALIADPDAPRPLADSELPTAAAGVAYVDPDRRQAFLVAHGLPPLPVDQRYQVWLFADTGERVSGGHLAVAANGYGQLLLEAPEPFAAYAAIGLSAEPAAGSDAPTAPLALGGWLDQPNE